MLTENYLETLTDENNDKDHIAQKLMKIAFAVKLPVNFDEAVALQAYFEHKHL